MFRIVLTTSCLILTIGAQFQNSKGAKILKEQRFNAGDGRFGSAYAQEDGTVSREEVTADGERVGQYSYIGQDGNTVLVKYTAGKDGFRILEGDHVPKGATGLNSAAYDPEVALQSRNIGQEETRSESARVRPGPVRSQQVQPQQVQQGQVNPFINPADPTHTDLKFNTNAAQFQPQQQARPAFQPPQQQVQQQQRFQSQQQSFQPQQQSFQPQQQQQRRQPETFDSSKFSNSVPACAGCEGLNPFINPADSSHSDLFPQHQFQSPQPAQPAQPAQQSFQPAQQSFQPSQQSFQQGQQSFQQPASTFPIQQQQQQQFRPQQQIQSQQQFQSQQFQPRQPAAQPIQPAFLQQQQQQQFRPQQQIQSQQQFQPQQFQPRQQFQAQQQSQQQFQPRQQSQQQFQPRQQSQQQFQPRHQFQQPSAEELAHQRLGESQIQEAVQLQKCLSSPGSAGC